jgi:hypothetical protein
MRASVCEICTQDKTGRGRPATGRTECDLRLHLAPMHAAVAHLNTEGGIGVVLTRIRLSIQEGLVAGD